MSVLCVILFFCFFFSSRRRHTRCALVTGVQTCALPIYSKARAASPDDPEIALGEAVAWCEAGEIDRGLAALDKISAANPAWVKAHAALGKFLWEGGRGEQLAAPFHRAIRHRPDDPDLRTTLIALLMQDRKSTRLNSSPSCAP